MSKKFAFVFPGQGSQSLGMLGALVAEFSCVQEVFNDASVVLGYDLWDVVQNGPKERLNSTEVTQPAMLVADIAVFRVWQTLTEAKPCVLAGHSLGEYSALVVADALDFKDAVGLVAKRGEYMQAAVPADVGAMAAIVGLSDEKLEAVCQKAASGEVVGPANYNSVGQTVIAGHKDAVLRAVDLAKEAGAKLARLIPVSVPSHSPLMQPAALKLVEALSSINIRAPRIPVIHNFDVASHTSPEDISAALVGQLTQPVRWVETIVAIKAKGIEVCVECGPGKVLSGLIKRIDRSLLALPVESVLQIKTAIETVS